MGFEAINLRRFILAKRVNNKSHPTGWLLLLAEDGIGFERAAPVRTPVATFILSLWGQNVNRILHP